MVVERTGIVDWGVGLGQRGRAERIMGKDKRGGSGVGSSLTKGVLETGGKKKASVDLAKQGAT